MSVPPVAFGGPTSHGAGGAEEDVDEKIRPMLMIAPTSAMTSVRRICLGVEECEALAREDSLGIFAPAVLV